MKAEILVEAKKEVGKMLEAGFIRPYKYAEWISSVVPVQKKMADGESVWTSGTSTGLLLRTNTRCLLRRY
jgi:hypothetical protein